MAQRAEAWVGRKYVICVWWKAFASWVSGNAVGRTAALSKKYCLGEILLLCRARVHVPALAEGGYAAGAGTILGSGRVSSLAEKRVAVRSVIQLHTGSSTAATWGARGEFSSADASCRSSFRASWRSAPGPCLLLHERRHFWYILMASEVTEFPLMICLSAEECLTALNHLFFLSPNSV